MKIVTILGARPQFIKAAVVSRAIASHNAIHKTVNIREIIVHTGQHYDSNMSRIFFEEMDIPDPKYNLGIGNSSHGSMTGRMLEHIETVLVKEAPDVVLVYGDTNSTLAGALAAVKLHIPVAHVEAGLRSFNMDMPEEINRILTDRISSFLFCPTEVAINNLCNERMKHIELSSHSPFILNVGDVMYDAVLFYRVNCQSSKGIADLINQLGRPFYLATIHRAENTDNMDNLRNIAEALSEINESIPVVIPMHPRTRNKINEHCLCFNTIQIIEPVGYFDMLTLLDHCKAVFTDSGGLQKEAYFFKKPCITLRNETEWTELVEHGFNTLVGANKDAIVSAGKNINLSIDQFSILLYGEGNAGNKIVNVLVNHFSGQEIT